MTIAIKQTTSLCLNDQKVYRPNCMLCPVRSKMLFSGLDIEALDGVLSSITNYRVGAGQAIYHQGAAAGGVYSIRSGFVKLVHHNHDGQERIVRLQGEGACVGLESLLNNEYGHSAIAITETDVCSVPKATIEQIKLLQPMIYESLQKQWAEHLLQADTWLAELGAGTVKYRIIKLIQILMDTQKLAGDRVVLLSNHDTASILATAEESISRNISSLKNSGLIRKVEKRTYQVDVTQLGEWLLSFENKLNDHSLQV
ncbi:Crp/Fnr family transcriptional regulator [Alkalimarinus sediminis]|uniref:Crp/Fnr family transcriptional regulator n=1 Tax=Alkalimarinus sediminis TaxID=1632866 RepID=A0A9E8KQ87_9ALTE|nr:Crp/Fnr family transcriptional regulator [Alkalimarinus sediminis]UZW74945.1 Crp/Fnr family transcriptional regulator [Alkalimarinus sediminis]